MPIDAHLLPRLDARAEIAHGLAIDHHASGADQVFDVPPRAESGVSEEFVEAIHTVIIDVLPSRAVSLARGSVRRTPLAGLVQCSRIPTDNHQLLRTGR